MKKLSFLTIPVFILFTLSGCSLFSIIGSGNIVNNEYAFTGFTSVKAGYTCDVTITEGSDYSVTISCDDNVVPYLETYTLANVLHINLKPGSSFSNFTFKATIVMPDLSSLNMSGASSAKVSGFDSNEDFRVVVSGASNANINLISIGNLRCNISGASQLNLGSTSSSADITINCSGASTIDLRNFSAQNGNVSVSGASTAYINIDGNLSGSVSGASTLYYRGNLKSNNVSVSIASKLKVF